ncbi:hypothetical protein PCO31111_04567 [Pandoraea communis]|uniref:Uncharacterized protein n=1 Tax=Pandoraea communis TaxID=2508297 RepID=A0A5E4YHV1_9BURK|nr:hypothetical protein PCO31111_04567 [Pandoraea communis]
MTAALRKGLIFQLNHRGPGTLEASHGTFDVEGVAEAGIGVDDHGNVDALGNGLRRAAEFDTGFFEQHQQRLALKLFALELDDPLRHMCCDVRQGASLRAAYTDAFVDRRTETLVCSPMLTMFSSKPVRCAFSREMPGVLPPVQLVVDVPKIPDHPPSTRS